MRKIRVLFPYVEAGFGHIMPMRSIEESFKKKYGGKVDVISSAFFTETGDRHLMKYEKMISQQVRLYNRFPVIGHLVSIGGEILGTRLSTFIATRLFSPIAHRRGLRHMRELAPDVVVSTHWASNRFAELMKDKPYTVMYCPDARLNKLFMHRADLNMISMPDGYARALGKKRYNTDNMKLVPFFIRNCAFDIVCDKTELRQRLGIPADKFTVLFAEGGYGIGKMEKVISRLAKSGVPMTLLAVCGTNEKLRRRLLKLECPPGITLIPYAFADNMLELQAASDLFCGKSGNILAESTFFGNPSVVTHFANPIEKHIAAHYINTVGCTVKEFSVKKAAALICRFALDRALLEPYRRAALNYHENFGSQVAADIIFEKIREAFPGRI